MKGTWDRPPLKLADALLFTAGAGILMGIITAEALYPAALPALRTVRTPR